MSERVQRFMAFSRVFRTPDGQLVLEALDRLTYGPIRPGENTPIDPLQLAVLHGRRDVVQFIRDQLSGAEKEENHA